jgi:CRP-like cAMP-binding protein
MNHMAMDQKKGEIAFNKGQVLFRQGEPCNKLFILKTGLLSLTQDRDGKSIEIFRATPPQVVGVEALAGQVTYTHTATALNDTQVIELASNPLKAILQKTQNSTGAITDALIQKYQMMMSDILVHALVDSSIPCPPALTAKLFATIFQVASYTSEKKANKQRVVWPSFRKYCQRVFTESPVRLEQAIYLLQSLGYAETELVKDSADPKATEVLGFVHFSNLDQIESFANFFRKRFKTLGTQNSMNTQDQCLSSAEAILRTFVSKTTPLAAEPIYVPTEKVFAELKEELGIDHVDREFISALIARGLPVELVTKEGVEQIQFAPEDIKKMFKNWRIMTSISDWNKSGKAPGAPNLG